jgi:surface protein
MRKAFQGATNLEINASDEPDLSNATSMLEMFSGATSVNGGLENWDVSTITSMFGVFDGATSFNGDISGWTVSAATDMIRMFAGATSFNQNLGGWNISSVTTMESMLSNSGLSTENYDNTLTGWAAQTVESEVDLGADGLTYCDGADARGVLTGAPNNWTITGDELAEDCGAAEFAPFITTWKTDNDGDSDDQSIRIPMIGNGYDFNVDWGDGSDEDYNTNPGSGNTHFLEHTYSSSGIYEVKITGDFPRIYFNFSGDRQKILTIEQWGDIEWASMEDAFHGAIKLTYTATDTPDLSDVSSMRDMFKNAELFNGDIGDWNVEFVEDMSSMFREADAFNGDIGDWDVSGVTNMAFMFYGADLFNQDIGSWNVSDVEEMRFMFGSTGAFNQDISTKTVNAGTPDVYKAWDVSNVQIMRSMFEDADAFNQDIGNWDVSSVTDMVGMFKNADIFNQDLSMKTVNAGTSDEYEAWNMSNAQFMSIMFSGAQAFNQNLASWNIASAESMTGMLDNSGLSTENYDNTLIGWESQSVQNGVTLGADGLTYCNGETARQALIDDHNWTFMNDELTESCGDEPVVLDAPTLSSPDDESNDVNRPATLIWAAVDDATSYDVQVVLESGSFDSPFFDEQSADTDIEVPGLDPSAEYKWRVRAVNNETQSEWSEIWTFTTNADEEELVAPQLSSPSNEATDISLTVNLDWDAAGGAESYQVQLVEESGSFDTPNFESETSDTNIGLELDPLTEYKWRVRSLTSDDESEWSEVWTFTTMGLPEGEDQRIFVSNASDYEFSKSDFGVSNDNFSIKIETLPDEGTLLFDDDPVNPDDEISIEDIKNDMLTWAPPSDEYGYNFTSFDFYILDGDENQSDEAFKLTIDLGTVFAELSGSEGWRFMTNPSDGDSYFDLLSGITVETSAPSAQTLYELDQEAYAWDPVGSTGDEPGVGTPFIVYVLEDDLPETVESGSNWMGLDGSFSYSGLDYDPSDPNPDNFFLVANPHPIALDFCQFNEQNIATSAYFWDPEANGGNGDYVNLNCAAEDVLIAPFQSFWIRTTDTNPMLDIPISAYLEDTTEGYFKEKSEQEEQFLITLNIAGMEGLFTNKSQILFTKDASEDLDRFDAPKLSAEGLAKDWLSFYSMDANDRAYAFQSLPVSDLTGDKVRIPLDIQTTESGRFTMDWTLPESHIFSGNYYLKDNQTGEVIELRDGVSYGFEIKDEDAIQAKEAKATHPMSEIADNLSSQSNTHRMSSKATPRFELLIAGIGVDGLTELGAVPDDFTLAQNYPNPFNPTTVISYQLPMSSEVQLEVYDMLGRNVATLVNGQVSAGRHTVNFDASNLSSGVYLYRLQAGSQIMTKKLTILK